jgi:hypothetical protein
MALRRLLGCLPVAALALCALTACKDGSGDSKDDAGGKSTATLTGAQGLDKRCEKLGNACGAKDKKQDKLIEECKAAAKQQTEKGCADKAVAVYDCYEKELCEPQLKVWAMDDFRVLAERHGKCVPQRDAFDACIGSAK